MKDLEKMAFKKGTLMLSFLAGISWLSWATSALAADLAGPAPRFDAWKIMGPGGGGTMISPVLSFHDPNLVVEHCDMTGGYITADGGQSWRMFNLRSGISTFAFDPGRASVLYAGNAALWRSRDSGRTWHLVFPDPKKKFTEHMVGDHADYFLTSEDPAYPYSGKEAGIDGIAVDPADSRRVYLAFSGSSQRGNARVLGTLDDGESWQPLGEFGPERVLFLHAGPDGPGGKTQLRVVLESGAFRLSGEEWKKGAALPAGPIQYASVGMMADRKKTLIYASSTPRGKGGALYLSTDSGDSWTDLTPSLLAGIAAENGKSPRLQAVSCALESASTAYLSFQGLRLGPGPENLYNGIARTTDAGEHWTIVHKESNHASSNLQGSWVEGRAVNGYPNIWFDAPYSLGVAPRNPDICFATDLFRTYRTGDGGKTWAQVHSAARGEDRWTSRGLDVTTCYGVHFDPFNSRHIYITYTDIGLFQSNDQGRSWTGSTLGIPSDWRNTTYWIEFEPKVQDFIWGAFSAPHDLPRPKMWRGRSPSRYRGGVAISRDGGRNWTLSNQGMPESAVTHILLDPESPVGNRTLYACAFGRGVYKSTDNGASWNLKNEGIRQPEPFAWRLTRGKEGTLYLVVARRSEAGGTGGPGDGALYVSKDGAEHWTPVSLPPGTNGPMGLAIDPEDPRRLYLSAWGVKGVLQDSGGGVFLSVDGGSSWKTLFDATQHVYDLTIDPVDPKILYLCGFDSAAYRSTDRGKSWTRLQGFNFKWGHRVIPDPLDRSKVYITTYGGSVWHGPAAGDPGAPEDVVFSGGSK